MEGAYGKEREYNKPEVRFVYVYCCVDMSSRVVADVGKLVFRNSSRTKYCVCVYVVCICSLVRRSCVNILSKL